MKRFHQTITEDQLHLSYFPTDLKKSEEIFRHQRNSIVLWTMKNEVKSAVDFLANILRTSKHVSEQQVHIFKENLQNLLSSKFENHWFPSKPNKGSGYRCIRINHKMDPLLLQAGHSCGLNETVIFSIIPKELTIWVDPFDVSYRIGENGSIGVLFESANTSINDNSSSSMSSTSSSSSLSSGIESPSPMSMMSFSANSCKGQFMSEFPRDMGLKQFAAYVYSWLKSRCVCFPSFKLAASHLYIFFSRITTYFIVIMDYEYGNNSIFKKKIFFFSFTC